MVSIFNTLIDNNPLGVTFLTAALIGSLFFFIKTLLLLLGSMVDTDINDHGDTDYSMEHELDHHEVQTHDGHSLRIFSLHSLSGFLMMFGWTGLACSKQLNISPLGALFFACLAGLGTIFASGYLFSLSTKLQSKGTVFDTHKTVNKVASVYTRIPAHGIGKIQLEIDNITHELLAKSAHNTKIDSFKKVRVLRVLDKETVLVEEIL